MENKHSKLRIQILIIKFKPVTPNIIKLILNTQMHEKFLRSIHILLHKLY